MKTYTLSEIVSDTKAGDYWIRGHLQVKDDNQALYYIGCSNCRKKVNADIGHNYNCFLCKKTLLQVYDKTASIDVIAIEYIAEKILQSTRGDMIQLQNKGERINIQSIKASLEGKTFLMLLRRTFSKNNRNERRLMLVSFNEEKKYAEQPVPTSEYQTIPSPSSGIHLLNYAAETELPLSPLKRQLSQVTISSGTSTKKQLIWNESQEDEGNCSTEKSNE